MMKIRVKVMEYESTPFIPPPFTPLSHAALAIRYVKMRLRRVFNKRDADGNREKKMFDFSLSAFLWSPPQDFVRMHLCLQSSF